MKSKLITIHPDDNVMTVARAVVPGDREAVGNTTVTFDVALAAGHKVARRNIAVGEKVIKFGVPIGSATRNIRVGEHVHLHNLKSDFINTYTLENEFTDKR